IVALTPRNAPPDAAARSRREAGFKAILGEIESWAARNDLTIALRSAACREISNTILRGVEQPASGDMLRQTRTVLLRAGVDS
ncbi:hypothetical protein, partial [uncultured Abyssibacter sp.]|uniref:hypothetical protein n=1 Tax=uncultured Abyssibacter sp. TaxID=2320202 RepID=UPI0032B2A293